MKLRDEGDYKYQFMVLNIVVGLRAGEEGERKKKADTVACPTKFLKVFPGKEMSCIPGEVVPLLREYTT